MPKFFSRLALVLLVGLASRVMAKPVLDMYGGSSALQKNIRAYLDIGSHSCRLSAWRVRSLRRDLDQKIQSAGEALGYYHLTARKQFNRENNCWRLTLDITPGSPVRFGHISIVVLGEGKNNERLASVLVNSPLHEGAPLNHGSYETFKDNILKAMNNQGYFDAHFVTAKVLVSRQQNIARVNLALDTGVRYKLGKITIKHDILSDDLINRYITLKAGQHYSADKIITLKSELQSSNYFGRVSIVPQLQSLNHAKVPVDIDLRAGPRNRYSVGAGYATDTGPRILLGYENRYVNSRGHSFDANVNASKVITTYQVGYTIPMARPAYQKLRFFTGFSQEKINQSLSNRLASGVTYSSWESSKWLNTIGLSYEREDYAFGDAPTRRAKLLIPTYSSSYSSAKNVNYPRSGWSALIRFKGASERLASSTDFAQAYGRLKVILPAGKGRLLLRGEAGVTEVDDFSKLPISQRFFAGGDASVRGYNYKSLGPKNTDDIVIGGSRLITASIEYDHKIYGDWVAAAFYDEGSAFNDGYVKRYRGVGLGVRWISPVGPLRVDIARALDGSKSWRLHLSVGPDL